MTHPIDPKRVAARQLSPPMVSYAQNFADVMLRRVLQDVKAGTYIDVGAQDSTVDSVTKWFYDSGWSGINIEPHPDYFAQLTRDRPRDINLKNAGADTEGNAQFCFHATRGCRHSTWVRQRLPQSMVLPARWARWKSGRSIRFFGNTRCPRFTLRKSISRAVRRKHSPALI